MTLLLASDHSSILDALLLRYGLIALFVIVAAGVLLFVAARLTRRGRGEDVRRYADEALRVWQSRRR